MKKTPTKLLLCIYALLVVYPSACRASEQLPLDLIHRILERSVQMSRLLSTESADDLETRYQMLAFYCQKLDKDRESYSVQDILKFAQTTRNLLVARKLQQASLDVAAQIDGDCSKLAQITGCQYQKVASEKFQRQRAVPRALDSRVEDLSFALFYLERDGAQIYAESGRAASPQESRFQQDLQLLTTAAKRMEQGIKEKTLTEQVFVDFQAARARWEVSKMYGPVILRGRCVDLAKLAQTCAELWRGGV